MLRIGEKMQLFPMKSRGGTRKNTQLLAAWLEVCYVVDVDDRAGRGAGSAAQAKGAGRVIGRVSGHAPGRGLPPSDLRLYRG